MEEDSKLNYSAALQLYSKGLEEFLQIIFNEPNTNRKAALRERANVYLQRAEELKEFCNQGTSAETNCTKPIATSSQQVQTGQTTQQNNKTTLPAFTYIKLRMVCVLGFTVYFTNNNKPYKQINCVHPVNRC